MEGLTPIPPSEVLTHLSPRTQFHRIRHCGQLVGASRKANVAKIRSLLGAEAPSQADAPSAESIPFTLRELWPGLRPPDAHRRDIPSWPATQSPRATPKGRRMMKRMSHQPSLAGICDAFRGGGLPQAIQQTAKPPMPAYERPVTPIPSPWPPPWDWTAFLGFLPMGIVFGAVHALTPGHSKAVLAIYLTGSSAGITRGLTVSIALSVAHVTMTVIIALFSLPLVSVMLGSAGSAALLEDVSRGLFGVIGVWMLWSALFRPPHFHGESESIAVGFMAGLIPCLLTLFVMTFAISGGVPEADILFAIVMMTGVALTLSGVALSTVFFRTLIEKLLAARRELLVKASKTLEAVAGVILVAFAIHEIFMRDPSDRTA
jgi:ABC-type nickel/cobalt efflux system permease component RcnA